MALTECVDCGGPVSDKAIACPKCGRPPDPPSIESNHRVLENAPPFASKWPALLIFGLLLIVSAVGISQYRDPGMEMMRAFPSYAEEGQRDHQQLAQSMMNSVRESLDPKMTLKNQATDFYLQKLFGYGQVVESGECGLFATGAADCEKFVKIQPTDGPVLWIYLEKRHASLPRPGRWVAFESCLLTDVDVALGADPAIAKDSAWWVSCRDSDVPTVIGRDPLTIWANLTK